MKDLVSIQDYLFQVSEVGDWEGEEELVADKINTIYHAVWQKIPEDVSVEQVDILFPKIWDELRGSTVLLDVDEHELIDWALAYMRQQLQNRKLALDTTDDEE
ncbi:hypothetical protein [Rheinheimera sp. MMS21-TC3]|uniref:hypothetical protein n=1 Tax=Rheinheimera sp. MMS21-TC3 TaxID=3072790 RepID=UPI0028C3FD47|nr:hypothetical protein [Rheinheimera sp. MMS21-TC3]WNO60946.1 hypothetical protein RDV63_08290 [Rheinheimera sp. MMS21-TC3]